MAQTTSVRNPADVINAALVQIGPRVRIGNLYDGSDAAKKALDIYGQTRDQLLGEDDWDFAERDAVLTLLKEAPAAGYIPPTDWTTAYPPLGFMYEYAYPDDCIKVRIVKPTPLFNLNFEPRPNPWRLYNDSALSPPALTILSNVADAKITYTARITDPTSWNIGFTEALIAGLARRLIPALGNPQMLQEAATHEQIETATAEMQRG